MELFPCLRDIIRIKHIYFLSSKLLKPYAMSNETMFEMREAYQQNLCLTDERIITMLPYDSNETT